MTRLRELIRREILEHLTEVYRLDGELRALRAGDEAEDAPGTPSSRRSGVDGSVNESAEADPPWWAEGS